MFLVTVKIYQQTTLRDIFYSIALSQLGLWSICI